MKKLIMVISLGLTGSLIGCTAIPKFPEIACIPTQKLSDKQLSEIKAVCKKNVIVCPIERKTFMQIFNNYQNKSACLEQYQETAKVYK